MYNWSGKI